MANNQRVLQFDILRAIAIILVLIHHIPKKWIANMDDSLITEFFWRVYTGGWIGVDMFFVLSGFLVSGIYFREYQKSNTISVGSFLLRRGFKIYPTFYFYLLITILISYYSNLEINSKQLFGEVAFIQNYSDRIWGPTWSLAVEEHFYLFLTLVFFLLRYLYKDNIFKCIPRLFIIIASSCLVLRIVTNINDPIFNFATQYQPTHLRIDSLMFGVLICYYYYFKPEKLQFLEKRKYLVLIISILNLLPYFIIGRDFFDKYDLPSIISTIGFTHLNISFGLILIAFWNIPINLNFFTKILSFIGKTSYASYLWHAPIVYFLELWFNNIWYTILYLTLVFLISYISTVLIEVPFLNLRDKLFPSKSGQIKKQIIPKPTFNLQ